MTIDTRAYLDGVAGGIEGLIADEEVQVLDALCDAPCVGVSHSCRLLDGNRRGNNELRLFIPGKSQFGVADGCADKQSVSQSTSFPSNWRPPRAIETKNSPGAHIDYACR